MKVLVSGCLLGENCKYNGGNNYSEKVATYIKGHEVISVCPECLGGLPTPRVPAEIVNGVVTNREGKVVDAEFRKGAEIALEIAKKEQIDVAILQSRSPSCGVKQIYDGTFSHTLVAGDGVTTKLFLENDILVLNENNFKEYLLK